MAIVGSIANSVARSVVGANTDWEQPNAGISVEDLLATASVRLKDDNIVESGGLVTEWTNSGIGGASDDLDVVIGTAAKIRKSISDAMLLYGAATDYASTPDSAASSVESDIDIRVKVSMIDWSPAGNQTFIGKWLGTGDERSYIFWIEAAGTLKFNLSANGIAGVAVSSSAAVPFSAGDTGWVRATWSDSGNVVNFYTSTDATDDDTEVSWTLLGTADRSLVSAGIFDGTSLTEVGAYQAGSSPIKGSIHRAAVYDGIEGTLVLDFDAADYVNRTSDTQFPSTATSEAWTLKGDTFIQNTGHDVVDDIGAVALESTAGQDIATFTAYFVVRFKDSSPSADQFLFDARSDAAKSVRVFTDFSNSNKLTLDAGGTPIALTGVYTTAFQVIVVQYTADADTVLTAGGESVTGNAGAEVLDYLTLGADLSGANTGPKAIGEGLFFSEAHTPAQITTLSDYLTARFGL